MLVSGDDNILEANSLTKRFGNFAAVTDVNLKVRRHSIHAMIGPNGAGKTTTFNLISKFTTPTGGSLRYNGEDVTQMSPSAVARKGIVRSFQISAIFPRMTVAENVRLALLRPAGLALRFWRSEQSLTGLNGRIGELLEKVGLHHKHDSFAGSLPYGQRRALEFATTLALDPELMLLDEPTSGLGHEDVDRIADLIRAVSLDRTILMVEHNLTVVARLADKITVLARGRVLAEGPYDAVSSDKRVIEAYIGDTNV